MMMCSPCHSMILDLDDMNWADMFTDEELDEMRDFGEPMLRDLPADLDTALMELQEKVLKLLFANMASLYLSKGGLYELRHQLWMHSFLLSNCVATQQKTIS